jgi:hypothetical protein
MLMRWTLQRARLYLLLLALLSTTGRAQSSSAGGAIPVKLTLAEVVRLALKQNPERAAARDQEPDLRAGIASFAKCNRKFH